MSRYPPHGIRRHSKDTIHYNILSKIMVYLSNQHFTWLKIRCHGNQVWNLNECTSCNCFTNISRYQDK